MHDEEPDTKHIILDDDDENMEGDQGADLDEVRARREDEDIVCRYVLGKNLHDVYSNERFQLAANRQSVEVMSRQLLGVDVMEIFSPERVGKLCKEYGLDKGSSMDIKSGYDFDKAEDRKRCWEAATKDEPKLVIGSPPYTMFSRLQELNKFMYKNDREWMQRFEELLGQTKRYVKFCASIYEHQRAHGRYFLHGHPWLRNQMADGRDDQA